MEKKKSQMMAHRFTWLCTLSIVFVAVAACMTGTSWADGIPIPSREARAKARDKIEKLFQKELSEARSEFSRTALAKLLHETALNTAAVDSQFELLELSIELASEAGNLELSLKAFDSKASIFETDVLVEKTELIDKVTRRINKDSDLQLIVPVVESAIRKEQFDLAEKLAESGLKAARKLRERETVESMSQVRDWVRLNENKWNESKEAKQILALDPTNEKASTIRGRYLCLFKDDWKTGLPLMKAGADDALRAIIELEQGKNESAKDSVKLGDAWWEWVTEDTKKRNAFHAATRFWYKRSLNSVSGLEWRRIKLRLDRLGESKYVRGGNRNFSKPVTPTMTVAELGDFAWQSGGRIGGWHAAGDFRVHAAPISLPPEFVFKRIAIGKKHKTRDDDLKMFSGHPDLSQIYIYNSALDGSGFKQYLPKQKFSGIWIYCVESTQNRKHMQDVHIRNLIENNPLIYFTLQAAGSMTKETFKTITESKIEKLELHCYPSMTNQSISELSGMKQLEELVIESSNLSELDLSPLTKLPNLEVLHLPNTGLSGDGLAQITSIPKLKKLRLRNAKISNQDLAPLTKTNLVELNLTGTLVTDQALDTIAKIESLKRVDLWKTKVTRDSVKRLKAMRPELKVRVD